MLAFKTCHKGLAENKVRLSNRKGEFQPLIFVILVTVNLGSETNADLFWILIKAFSSLFYVTLNKSHELHNYSVIYGWPHKSLEAKIYSRTALLWKKKKSPKWLVHYLCNLLLNYPEYKHISFKNRFSLTLHGTTKRFSYNNILQWPLIKDSNRHHHLLFLQTSLMR